MNKLNKRWMITLVILIFFIVGLGIVTLAQVETNNKNNERGVFISPISGEEYIISKDIETEKLEYINSEGKVFSGKEEIFNYEVKNYPNINYKLDDYLRNIVDESKINENLRKENIGIIISLKEQPTHDVSLRVKEKYKPQFEEITKPAKEIYDRIKPLMGIEDQARSNYSRSLPELIALEQSLLTEEEKVTLNEIGIELESKVSQMRSEILKETEPLLDSAQEPIIQKINENGGKVTYEGKIFNAIAASVPISYLENLASESDIDVISYDSSLNPQLDDSVCEMHASSFWNNGYTGGIWDVAVVDTGIDGTHPNLNVFSSAVFHDAALGDPLYDDDPNDPDDRFGHGTAVTGPIVSEHSTYRGVAYGADALLNAKAGYKTTNGANMTESDSMAAIDWALDSSQAGADADVISFSWGNPNGGSGNTPWNRFFDAVVFDMDTQVIIAAGNDGPGPYTIANPADSFNVIGVGAVDDENNCGTNDDSIWSSSSRGPTGDNRRKPDLTAPGVKIHTTHNDWEGFGSNFVDVTGTSVAAPHVAGAVLLILDYVGTQWEPHAIKALLIKSADRGGPFSSAPDNTFGWGFVDLDWAYTTRDLVYTGSIDDKPEGEVEKLYKADFFLSDDRATLVWNRHVLYNGANYPSTFYDTSDIDLYMYEESNGNTIDFSISSVNNVEEVEADQYYPDVILKVEPFLNFPPGVNLEYYALATDRAVSLVNPPTLTATLTMPSTVECSGLFNVEVRVDNTGDIRAHDVFVALNLPPGFSINSGQNPQSLGVINGGSFGVASWIIQASGLGNAQLSADVFSYSYGDNYNSYDSGIITVGSAEICSDGVDNDCDGNIDCEDGDCVGETGPNGGICCVGNEANCPGVAACHSCGVDNECDFDNTATLCNSEYRCSNSPGGDNAYDNPDFRNPSQGFCDGGGQCDYGSSSPTCDLAEGTLQEGLALDICVDLQSLCIDTCSDGIDNDGDGDIDGEDSDCVGDAPPTVTLVSPPDNSVDDDRSITFNCSATDDYNLVNMTLYGNWSGGWHANETKSLSGTSDSATFTKTLDNGIYVWNCLAYDNSSQSDWADANWTINVNTTNVAPTTPIILHPNGGEILIGNFIKINWTISTDPDGDFVRYFLQYSNNSGTNWYNIISNYGFENKLNDSSTETTLNFFGNENKTVYLRLPKNATITSAKLDLTGLPS